MALLGHRRIPIQFTWLTYNMDQVTMTQLYLKVNRLHLSAHQFLLQLTVLHTVAVDGKEQEIHVHSLWLNTHAVVHATTANNLAHKTANVRDVLIPTELSHHFNLLHRDKNKRDSVIEVKLPLRGRLLFLWKLLVSQ